MEQVEKGLAYLLFHAWAKRQRKDYEEVGIETAEASGPLKMSVICRLYIKEPQQKMSFSCLRCGDHQDSIREMLVEQCCNCFGVWFPNILAQGEGEEEGYGDLVLVFLL